MQCGVTYSLNSNQVLTDVAPAPDVKLLALDMLICGCVFGRKRLPDIMRLIRVKAYRTPSVATERACRLTTTN